MKAKPTLDESAIEIVHEIAEQAEKRSHNHDRLIDLIGDLDIQAEWFTNDARSDAAHYDIESIAAICLYKCARGMSYRGVVDFLTTTEGETILGLSEIPSPQTINYAWRNRFDITERSVIRQAALRVRFTHDFH